MAALTACSSSGGDKNSIAVTPTSIDVPASGGVATVSVTASSKWTATSTNTAFTVNPKASAKGGTFTVYVSGNVNKDAAQSGTVTFSCGNATAVLNVTQQSLLFSVEPETLTFTADAESKTIAIKCNDNWSIGIAQPAWIESVSPLKGHGDATITINTLKTKVKEEQRCNMGIMVGSMKKNVSLVKEAAKNHAPTAPVLVSPADNATGEENMPVFKWNASTDEDDDPVTYSVCYSTDQTKWSQEDAGGSTTCNSIHLELSTKYYWKVIAKDNSGATAESAVFSFTTRQDYGPYKDFEYRCYQKSKYNEEFILLFTGDGYTQDMFNDGGKFDTDVNKTIEGLFQIEPYKTYRDYFTVYKIAAFSNETGVSIGEKKDNVLNLTTNKDTKYHCYWKGGNSTSMGVGNSNALDRAWATVPELATDEMQTKSPICIVVNADIYAGTNWSSGNTGWKGTCIKSYCMVPLGDPKYSAKIENITQHEFGGHGIGLLTDEYTGSGAGYSETRVLDDESKAKKEQWQNWGPLGMGWNVCFTGDIAQSPWVQFATETRYVNAGLGMYQGGGTFDIGVWRPSVNSCMKDNRPWYNVQSRWLIYKRIMWTLGKTPSKADFMANDHETQESASGTGQMLAQPTPSDFRPLGEPQFEEPHVNPYNRK